MGHDAAANYETGIESVAHPSNARLSEVIEQMEEISSA